jgi:[ribosomal protein S5]-alanine N-acetyltransferase
MTITSFYQQDFPIIDIDENYYLREQLKKDTPAFFNYYTDPEVSRYILATIPTTLVEAESEIYYCQTLFRQQQGIYWTIARKDSNEMIGAIGFYINNFHHRAEISYDMSKEYWGQGIMTKAIQIVSQYAFDKIGAIRIEAITLKENLNSIKVLERNGFIHEGTLHNYKYFKDKAWDIEIFALVPPK